MQKLLASLDLREHLMVPMLWTLGLRPSELFARRWRNVVENTLKVEDRVSRNKFGPTKTKSSRAPVALSSQLVMMLNAYRETAKFTEPNDLIFCAVRRNFSKLNYRRGVPVDHHNFLRRFLVPKLEELGLPRMNFQMFRRSCATF
ncbi:MAG TPA: tyrosine-type recombinase/integrase, partial [Terriglobia bacterium]|nr:tyrosine-type recombinase/integrase [Terriglobia bacterium]